MTRIALVSLFTLGLCTTPTYCQVATTGQIRGLVTDASGGNLPKVTITASSPSLMAPRVATTDTSGAYLFDLLPPGVYELTYIAPRYKEEIRPDITINSGFTATVSPQLQIGPDKESVVVFARGPVVDTTNNTSTTIFDVPLLQGIPNGRDLFSTVAQTPGLASDEFDIAGSQSFQQPSMQVHGSLPGDQVFSFNGVRLNYPGGPGGNAGFYVDDEALSELQVVTDGGQAEIAVGGVYMNLVPKSGANEIHGGASLYYQSAGTQATIISPTYAGVPVPSGTPFIMARDSAADLGGPILRNRWWLFGAWHLDDVKESILSVTNPDGTPTADPNHQSNTILRSDHQLSPNNRLNFVWWYSGHNRFSRRDSSYAFVSPEASWREINPAYILQGTWNSQLHNLLFDTRFGYLHDVFPLENQSGTPANALNRQDVVASTESGAPPYSFVNNASALTFTEGMAYNRGRHWGASHNFKFGADVSVNQSSYRFNADQGINAIYDDGTPIEVYVYNTPVIEKNVYHETAAYAQDSISIRKKLTLNLGVRYDHFNSFYPAQVSPPAAFPDLFMQRSFAQSPDIATWNTFRPRLGAAYDLTGNGRSVIKCYFGQFDVIEGTGLAEQINPSGLSLQIYSWNDTNGDGTPQQNEWNSSSNLLYASGGVFTRVDPKLKRPYTNEVSVGYEQQVSASTKIGASYFFRNIKNQIAEVNLAAPTSEYTPTSVDNAGNAFVNPINGRPITLYNLNQAVVGMSDYLVTNIPALDTNHYNGVELTITKRMSNGWQVLAGYTLQEQKGVYSRGLSDDFNNPNNNINRANANLNLDSTQMFKLLSTYALPRVLSFGLNYQHYTGYPLDPNNGPPSAIFGDLNQGQVTVVAERIGGIRLPNVDIINLRLSRPTKVGDRFNIEPIVDLFNIGNTNTVIGEVPVISADPSQPSSFMRPTNQLNPFIARFALRLSF